MCLGLPGPSHMVRAAGVLGAIAIMSCGMHAHTPDRSRGFAFCAGMMLPEYCWTIHPEAAVHHHKSLPDIIDLLVVSAEAGTGSRWRSRLSGTAQKGPLPDEFDGCHRDPSRQTTDGILQDLSERCGIEDLKNLVAALHQRGVGREHCQHPPRPVRFPANPPEHADPGSCRHLVGQMLFPLIFCIFPSLFVVVLDLA